MRISQVILKNFRNFCDATINLNKNTLIIGANDVGKTNFLYAIRLLLDRTLSEADIEPTDSDFFAYGDEVEEFCICLKFVEVTDNIRARFAEKCKDDCLYLKYVANRDPKSGKTEYSIWAGPLNEKDQLTQLDARNYLRTLNIRYVSSSRNLASYIKRQKKYLLQEAKDGRTSEEVEQDNGLQEQVRSNLQSINTDIEKMSYIQKATTGINGELNKLSLHHGSQKVIFEVGANDPAVFIEGAHLASHVNERHLAIGGDGRNNQIFLSLWATQNKLNDDDEPVESIICAIEEPEAHLHPHQQRKLAEYLADSLNTQVLITSHSPQIASKFAPNAIVRFKSSSLQTSAASDGCTDQVVNAFVNFGHRLNAISSEAFFADTVFLVEGPSEALFYKALAPRIGIDLDRYNISILPVDGIGFERYVQILDALEISHVLRTDNDIFKVPQGKADDTPPKFRLAGVQRALNLYLSQLGVDWNNLPNDSPQEVKDLVNRREELNGLNSKSHEDLSPAERDLINTYRGELSDKGIFVAEIDLEHDLLNSPLSAYLNTFIQEFEEKENVADPIKSMQKNKATFMYNFLMKNEEYLAALDGDIIAAPLRLCVERAKANFSQPQPLTLEEDDGKPAAAGHH